MGTKQACLGCGLGRCEGGKRGRPPSLTCNQVLLCRENITRLHISKHGHSAPYELRLLVTVQVMTVGFLTGGIRRSDSLPWSPTGVSHGPGEALLDQLATNAWRRETSACLSSAFALVQNTHYNIAARTTHTNPLFYSPDSPEATAPIICF